MNLSSQQQATVEVFSGSLWEAEMIRTLLSDAQIAHFLKNSTLNDFMYDPIGAEGVKVMVLEDEVERAKRIIDNYLQNLNK